MAGVDSVVGLRGAAGRHGGRAPESGRVDLHRDARLRPRRYLEWLSRTAEDDRRVLAVVILAAVANFGVLWAFVYGTHRQAAPAAYASLDLRAHSFLADVPLHDVWVARLPGGGPGRTILDVQRLFSERGPDDVCPAIAVLAGVRYVLGQLFGWDDERFDVPAASYVHRLTEADRSHALDEPGDHLWAFRSIYSFEREAVGEIINGTVHAFLAVALDRTENGYVLFLAIYVKPVSGFTPTYMSLIDPFRRLFVYPWLLENLERDWSRRWGAAAGESPVRSSRSDG